MLTGRGTVSQYGLVALGTGLALAATHLSWPLLARTPFILLFAATMASARWAGEGPGLLSIPLAAGGYLWLIAQKFPDQWTLPALTVFVVVSCAVNRIVVARNRTEAKLRANEAQLRAGWENTVFGAALIDRDGQILRINPALSAMLRDQANDCERRRFTEISPPADAKAAWTCFLDVIAGARTVGRLELRLRRRDGSVFPVGIVMSPIRDARGGATGALLMVDDRTKAEQMEASLQTSKEAYRTLFEGVPAGLFQSAPDGRLLAANPALVQMLGYDSLEELQSLDIARDLYVDPQARTQVLGALERNAEVRSLEVLLRRKDGRRVTVLESAHAIRDHHGVTRYYEGTLVDISERKDLEEQLRQSQKMEAIGHLVSSIAHDFNNLLTAITGYSELVLRQIHGNEQARKDLEEVLKAGRRAAALTRRLLVFSRRPTLESRLVSLDAVVDSVSAMLNQLAGENVELRVALESGGAQVKIDPGHLEQIIVNLAVNARDAMPHGGRLTFESRVVELGDSYAPDRRTRPIPGPYVMLAVSDTGCGMDDTVKSHLFEPFFTTKPAEEGTGLGLATVYGIVKQAGGYIWVYSEPGFGSSFKVYFPRADRTNHPQALELRPQDGVMQGPTVLLIEDDDTVRTLARSALEAGACRVLEAKTGEQAVRVAETWTGSIELVVSDVVLPGITGCEAVRRVTCQRPATRALYMSGYAGWAMILNGALEADAVFLEKPFTREQFLGKVQEALGTALTEAQSTRVDE